MITLAEFKTYMKKTSDTEDSILQQSIDSAISTVNEHCNRDFRQGDYTDVINGNGKCKLYVKNWPLNSIASLKYLDADSRTWKDLISNTGDTIANSTYINKNKGCVELLKGYSFPKGCDNIEIIYNGGYSSVPAAIKAVCFEIANMYYNNSPAGNSMLGVQSENIGGQSASGKSFNFDKVIDKHLKTLNQFRQPTLR